jgi:aquaporin rerated protein, invertebrate
MIGHISGAYINPSITLTAVIWGAISIPMAGVYFLAQLIGACLGYGILLLVTPHFAFGDTEGFFCMTMPGKDVSSIQVTSELVHNDLE